MRLLTVLAALLVSLSLQAETFTFTAIPDQDESRLQQRFGQVAEYLQAQLGVSVTYIPVKSYAAAVNAFRNNQVQLAWFGGLSGVQARQRVPGSEAIAQGYEDQFFKTYFIANSRTGLEKSNAYPRDLTAMAELTFTFGSKGSTSGRLMPEYYIRLNHSKSPSAAFKRVGFSGDHSRTIALVQAGAYDLGAVNYKVWEKELADGLINPDKVKVIWETPTYPDYQWTIRGDVDSRWGEGFKAKVKTALLGMREKKLLAAFPRQSFVDASNDDYQPIKDTALAIGLIDN